MTYLLLSLLINLSVALAFLALVVLLLSLVVIMVLGRLRRVVHLSAVDLVEIRSRWRQSNLDLQERALLLDHQGRMLEAESDLAQMGIRAQRLELLTSLDESS